ncbi:MAG TPA: hypothetical protein VMS01_00235 [Stellaceae bacterium]|nr:hypothetical protein [Stellaceae bacterium]
MQVRKNAAELHRKRAAAGLATAELYLARHGWRGFTATSAARTASIFTVVGPAINEVSRILGDERSVAQNMLVSASFVDGPDARTRRGLVSVGRYAVSGVAQPQELFTPETRFRSAAVAAVNRTGLPIFGVGSASRVYARGAVRRRGVRRKP